MTGPDRAPSAPLPPEFDPRRTPARPDLAAAALKGRVTAARFVDGVDRRACRGRTPLTATPSAEARQTSELLFGERFTVFEDRPDGWVWGQAAADGYVGYAAAAAFGPWLGPPTHRVTAVLTHVYQAPDLKAPAREVLSLGSPLVAGAAAAGNPFVPVAGGGYVFAAHLQPWHAPPADAVATGARLVGLPYLWGGRSALGYDCSGLVQAVLGFAGYAAPRDSDMQAAELGDPVATDLARPTCRRGDLVFFPGHVGIMIDQDRLLHATAYTMSVTIEPLEAVARRDDPTRAAGIVGVRRLDPAAADRR